ncbi:hypothetical protein BaRGS_00023844 [Batillaria attramentaria]|uniref:C-type lectin domain-containing protein n=1 Tax=Batillaria attramentaria TaxID=370345 RepID=A0ABD0KCQ3_9CAEN
MTSCVTFLVLAVTMATRTGAVTDDEYGRKFVLIPTPMTWDEASDKCSEMNGTLGTIDSYDVIPDLGYDWGWTLWVGLKISDNMTWEDGAEVNWTHWSGAVDLNATNATCTAALTHRPYSWVQRPCSDLLASVCQIVEGSCHFVLVKGSSIKGFNDKIEELDRASCLEACRTARDFDCRSAEVHAQYNACQMSHENRWSQEAKFLINDRNWDYYHWTCVNAPEPEGEKVCVYVKPITKNETEEVREDVQELQDLGVTFKEQKRLKKKVSTPDPRASATYIGVFAMGFVAVVLGLIVCLDIMSLPRHLEQMHGITCGDCKIRKKLKFLKRREVKFTEYSEHRARILAAGDALVISPRVPHNFRPSGLTKDVNIERTYAGFGNDVQGVYVRRNDTSRRAEVESDASSAVTNDDDASLAQEVAASRTQINGASGRNATRASEINGASIKRRNRASRMGITDASVVEVNSRAGTQPSTSSEGYDSPHSKTNRRSDSAMGDTSPPDSSDDASCSDRSAASRGEAYGASYYSEEDETLFSRIERDSSLTDSDDGVDVFKLPDLGVLDGDENSGENMDTGENMDLGGNMDVGETVDLDGNGDASDSWKGSDKELDREARSKTATERLTDVEDVERCSSVLVERL